MDGVIELTKCTNCKCKKLQEFFEVKATTGVRYKTCNGCRVKHECPQCDASFGEKATLVRHVKHVHDKIKPHQCPQCDASFGQKGNLKDHVKTVHLKIKDIECPQCDASFGLKSKLDRHVKQVHLKVRDHQCPECDKAFSTKGDLKPHVKHVHLKIKDIECPQCDASFGLKGGLKAHIKQVHLKVRGHQCPECDKAFSMKGDLKVHAKICTGKLNISGGELACRKAFELLDIPYETEVSDIVNDEGNRLRFDFKLECLETMYVEFDGIQHFKPQRFGGMSKEKAQAAFEKLQRHDQIKNDYCRDSGIPLLRIPYMRLDETLELIRDFTA